MTLNLRRRRGGSLMRRPLVALVCTLVLLLLSVSNAMAHGVTLGDQGYISEISGVKLIPFIYLGAKHMVTGYDHLLFLLGVIFFLYGSRQIAAYVSLFAIGHSTTMLIGVYFGIGINGYIIDAIIGFSVVYKALDNLGAFRIWFGHQPNTKVATLIFGLLHGFGLASKILEYDIAADGLVPNLLAFNLGVEIGQIIALMMILLFMSHWRSRPSFVRQAYLANVVMMTIGFVLMGLQITGYVTA